MQVLTLAITTRANPAEAGLGVPPPVPTWTVPSPPCPVSGLQASLATSPGQCVMTYPTRASPCVLSHSSFSTCLHPGQLAPVAFAPDMRTLQRLEVRVCLCFYEHILCLYTRTPTCMSVQRVWPMGLG